MVFVVQSKAQSDYEKKKKIYEKEAMEAAEVRSPLPAASLCSVFLL